MAADDGFAFPRRAITSIAILEHHHHHQPLISPRMDGQLDGMPLVGRAFHGDAHDQHRQNGMIITSAVFTALALVFVAMRTVSRFCIIRNPGIDDVLLIVAAFLAAAFLACLAVAAANHVGFPSALLPASSIAALAKDALAMQVFYYVNVCVIKVSIVLTYLRFAVAPTFRRLCWATIAFHALLCVACILTIFLQSHPLSHMWSRDGSLELSIDLAAFFYATAGIHIATDLWILALPVPALARVRRPRRDKAALFALFGTGVFGTIASIVRLYGIHQYFYYAADQLQHCLALETWGAIETCVGICCASLTGIRPILRSTRSRLGSASRRSGSGSSAAAEKRRRRHRRRSDFFFSQNRQTRGPRRAVDDVEAALGEAGSVAIERGPGEQRDTVPAVPAVARPAATATAASSTASTTLNGSVGSNDASRRG